MKTHQTDFSKGSVYRNILEVAVPMTFAQLLNLLYNIVDRMYIGRLPDVGTLALTGVGLCFPIITLITAFTYLFGNGGGYSCSARQSTHKPHVLDQNPLEYPMRNWFWTHKDPEAPG